MKNTEEFYRFYKDRMIYKEAVPNDAHRALAKLEQEGKVKAVITQNIDGLHQMAGSRECWSCMAPYTEITAPLWTVYDLDYITNSEGVPRCTCGGTVKPDVVLYEEGLDDTVLRRSIEHISKADLLIVGGTSLAVYPAAA